jgi:hypothetical protein
MNEGKAGEELMNEAAEAALDSAPELLGTSMNIIIQCRREEMMLKYTNYFVKGGFVKRHPELGFQSDSNIDVLYFSDTFRKSLKGVLICQLEDETESTVDTFIIIIWKLSLLGSPRFYIGLIETERGRSKWDSNSMKDINHSVIN